MFRQSTFTSLSLLAILLAGVHPEGAAASPSRSVICNKDIAARFTVSCEEFCGHSSCRQLFSEFLIPDIALEQFCECNADPSTECSSSSFKTLPEDCATTCNAGNAPDEANIQAFTCNATSLDDEDGDQGTKAPTCLCKQAAADSKSSKSGDAAEKAMDAPVKASNSGPLSMLTMVLLPNGTATNLNATGGRASTLLKTLKGLLSYVVSLLGSL